MSNKAAWKSWEPSSRSVHSEPATIDYDVVYIRETMEWLLTACTKIEDRQRKHSLICDQSFILRKRDANKDDL